MPSLAASRPRTWKPAAAALLRRAPGVARA